MKLNLKYLLVGLFTLGLLGAAEYRGWSPLSVVRAAEPVPTSVRDNPGAYRSHYVRTGRYTGGK